MRSALLVLAMPRCLDASRNATLNVVESLIDLEGGLGYNILMAHVDQLLESLRAIAVTAWSTPVSLLYSPPCFPRLLVTLASQRHRHCLFTVLSDASCCLALL